MRHPLRYALSFYGIIDLLSVLPTWLALLVPEAHYCLVCGTALPPLVRDGEGVK